MWLLYQEPNRHNPRSLVVASLLAVYRRWLVGDRLNSE